MIALHTISYLRGRGSRASVQPITVLTALVILAGCMAFGPAAHARPSTKSKKSGGAEPLNFLRQTNVYSNLEFFYTNRGVLFNAGKGQNEGCFWPRGSGHSYIFGEGLWFATKKEINGKLRSLCELGYNPSSGAGWYIEGENSQVGHTTGTDGAVPAAKYISYVGPRYDKTSGKYLGGYSVVPSPSYVWPIWDTSTTKTLNHNFYFGDYISDVTQRQKLSDAATGASIIKPAILSEEDIVNEYTDGDPVNNPEFHPGTGYPFGIDVTEAIYSWSFGRYRDMIFLRQKVTNSSADSLIDCWMAPAFDPDLDAAAGLDEGNSYVDDSLVTAVANPAMAAQLKLDFPDPSKLNMGVQWYNYSKPPGGKQYGWIGFSFLETPVIDSAGDIITNDDSTHLNGYGPNSLFQKNARGLVTFKDWVNGNDPSTQDLRYNFLSSGEKDLFSSYGNGDQRLMMSTGPFTLPPGKSAETVVGITIAQVDNVDYKKNFGALLLLTDFAHEVFGEVDSVALTDTTKGYFVNHFLSPTPPGIPNVKTTALDRAILVTWDTTAEVTKPKLLVADSLIKDTSLSFLGYQLWRSSRSDHDSTIRPDGNNPDIMLGDWHLYDFKTDSVFDKNGHFNHFHYARSNSVPHPIPHSYLDFGDDNHDGILTGNEGLYNGVQYYYYLIAYNEFDSLNQVGPLYSAIVAPKNLVVGIPNKPAYLVPFSTDTANNIAGNCLAGSGNPNFGGVQDVRLNISDTGIFAKLFTNDTINVSFQPRWTEYTNYIQSPLELYVDVTENKNNIQNTYATMQNPAKSTAAYYFPVSLPGSIVEHVNGTISVDSVFPAQFTSDNSTFAPNQSIDNAFKVLADVNLEQLSTPYRLSSVTVSGVGDPNILRLSHRTNNGAAADPNQNIFNLPSDSVIRPPLSLGQKQVIVAGTTASIGQTITRVQLGTSNDTVYTLNKFVRWSIDSLTNPGIYDTLSATYTSDSTLYYYQINSTRPSFLGALGETNYEITFDSSISPGPVPITMTDDSVINPSALLIHVRLAGCPDAQLRIVKDTASDMTKELDYQFYSATTSQGSSTFASFNDPDTMYVPNPGWYEMAAWHYQDPPNQNHSAATLDQQGTVGPGISGGTVGPYYFPINGSSNSSNGMYHYAVHRLSVGGAELIFNAPEVVDPSTTGDTIAGTPNHVAPHTTDFQVGDKITLSFTGIMKNLPFPGAQFTIKTESGPKVDYANLNNYTNSMLQQVQVVPNPYIVTHLGQTSTDNAKLFFTRLPPRCTIEIYALDGTLVNTIEHIGYQSTTTQNPADPAQTLTSYNYNQLADQASSETWNLLTSGKQRVGSQVLFARVVAKDPITGAETGEVTTKFAVVVGLSK